MRCAPSSRGRDRAVVVVFLVLGAAAFTNGAGEANLSWHLLVADIKMHGSLLTVEMLSQCSRHFRTRSGLPWQILGLAGFIFRLKP